MGLPTRVRIGVCGSKVATSNDVLCLWISLPEILHVISPDQLHRITSFFFPIVSSVLQSSSFQMDWNVAAMESNVAEIQQQCISTCSSILKNTNLLLQSLPSLSAMELSQWEQIAVDMMKTRCVRVEDALAASQLWVRMQLLRQTPTKELLSGEKRVLSDVKACGTLRVMMHRECVLNCPIEELHEMGFIRYVVMEIAAMSPSCSEEVICMLQTVTLVYSAYSTHKMNFPAPLTRSILNLILHHLDNTARKVSRVCEESLVNFIKQTPVHSESPRLIVEGRVYLRDPALFTNRDDRCQHIASHVFDSLRSASMRLSDERSLHASFSRHTAAQPALRTQSLLLLSDYFRLSESADRSLRRDASLAMDRCLHRPHRGNDLRITRWTCERV